jgi:hypothetical protein
MIQTEAAVVKNIIDESQSIQILEVVVGEKIEQALNYPFLTGPVEPGDEVVLNTTAVKLGLGTGGYHYVMHTPKTKSLSTIERPGHIMKLRYTPLQFAVQSCEEQDSPYHQLFTSAHSLAGIPVLVGELHSMLPILVTYIKHIRKESRIAYIMSEGASLSLPLSNHVRMLQQLGWLAGTVTVGQAFGGEIEAVNIYTALLAAKNIVNAEIIIIIMGPGIVGTGTNLGFSGMEQVAHLHAVASLGGLPVLVPRVSAKDSRARHQGISHHTIAVLSHTLTSVEVPLLERLQEQVVPCFIKHYIHYLPWDENNKLDQILSGYPQRISSMNRSYREDPLFFTSVALAADWVLQRC